MMYGNSSALTLSRKPRIGIPNSLGHFSDWPQTMLKTRVWGQTPCVQMSSLSAKLVINTDLKQAERLPQLKHRPCSVPLAVTQAMPCALGPDT